MGCDIHNWFEYKNKNGKWNLIEESEEDLFYLYRNYALFGALAGVRVNYKPIVWPRGLPKDLSSYIKDQEKRWGIDAHTKSWLSLRELSDALDNYVAKEFIYLDVYNYIKFKKNETFQQVRWDRIRNEQACSNEDMERYAKNVHIINGELPFTELLIREHGSLREISPALVEIVDYLKTKYDNLDDVRMVFFFDN